MDCYGAALRILNHRFNSEGELRRKLRAKEFPPAEIDEAITRLRAEKWLDDARFAAAFVRTRSARRIGPQRIRRELGAAGVDREVINSAVEANTDAESGRTALEELCEKRMRMLVRRKGEAFAESREGRDTVAAYLMRQGYPLEDVMEVLRARKRNAERRTQNAE
jgi:regulatory protein